MAVNLFNRCCASDWFSWLEQSIISLWSSFPPLYLLWTNGRDGLVFLALRRQISIDLVLRCSDAVIACYDFSPCFSIVYTLKQTVAKEHWNGRHQNWVQGQHSFLTFVSSLLKQGDCISEGFFSWTFIILGPGMRWYGSVLIREVHERKVSS